MQKNTVKIETDKDEIEVYTDEIFSRLDQYCQDAEIENLQDVSQSRWNALLIFLHKTVFENTDRLKRKPYTSYEEETGRRRNWKASNNNSYDYDKLQAIADIYIYLSFLYEKQVTIYGYSLLTGVTRQEIYNWGSDPTCGGFDIFKNLTETREETLSDRLYSGKSNPVGIIACLNHWHKWNVSGTTGETAQGTQSSIEQIQQRYVSMDEEQEQVDTQIVPGDSQEEVQELSFD